MRSGIILAGGDSQRMGVEKGLMDLDGKTIIQYVIDSLRPIVDEIIVVIGSMEKYPVFSEVVNVHLVPDQYVDGSPLVGILSGLSEAKGEYAVVVACDMPFINTDLVDHLFNLSMGHDGILLVKPNGWIEPLPSVYRVSVSLKQAFQLRRQGESRIRRILEALPDVPRVPVNQLRVIDPDLLTFFDIDTEDSYREAVKILRS